ncbi:hypothetical protein RB593_007246 [Gaeumannomyces tritici]
MEHNLQQCVQLVKEASAAGAKVLFLPEASDYIAENREQSLALARPESSSPFAAREHDVDVNVGIHVPAPAPASDETNQRRLLLNRTIHITGSSGGAIDARGTYDKLHLFDYGALRESAAGAALTPPFDTPRRPRRRPDVLRPALPRARPRAGPLGDPRPRRPGAGGPAQVLTYPSAFTVPTGLAHWEVLLLRARRRGAVLCGRRRPGRRPPPRGRAGRQGQLRAQHGRRPLGPRPVRPARGRGRRRGARGRGGARARRL